MEQMKLTTIVSQPKWKSKVLWTAIIAQILTILQITGLAEKWGVDLGIAGDLLAGILQLLVLFGIVNDAGNKEGL